ncbi:ADP compounds hydrolase NudE [Providencia stuartii]|uniref:ADP compounds hydrolase NudE n=2 Tax=Providencia TaxID=586 RepID=A0A1S1HSE8_PROST|nr:MULTISPECIES: ADP compounds hydrolase NudE [Providencia]MDV5228098.1 ADP compounds hydrolase NudE [Providencia rettgeri]ELR5040368.1 ADP compounds hydrolase NudE [Providencia stuartii]ELR5084168.1 ADP compounds hydrolase NudE [Providencia stuartii]ELR5115023.1 ADP compounds hydrolase NudE [Providencia stuartii]ELR5302197.1 ADP compounds hydrolase NudE [Providencia stuartii]
MTELKKPKILSIQDVAHSKLFSIQSVNLEFSNGEKRIYERMRPGKREAVLIVPIINDSVILIREYAVGIEDYELGFPKGAIDPGETPIEAAQRELKEEIGFGANQIKQVAKLTMSPSYFSSKMNILIADDLYSEKLEGDEPEPLQQVRWPIARMMELLEHPDFNEARNISALFYLERFLKHRV